MYNLYDNLGHVKTSTHSVSGLTGSYAFGYQWWLNDGLKEIDYPSGRVVKYDVDDAGRVKKVYGTSPSNWTYADMTATGITNPYAADGRLAQMQLGNGLYETREYHTPGTTTLYKLGTSAAGSQRLKLEYNFHATENNGNLINHGITNSSNTWTQSFSYDGVDRLSTAIETNGFSRTYGYDLYGNRRVSASSGLSTTDVHEPTVSTNFDANTNRLFVQGSDYDPAGNQTVYTPYTLAYDAENRNTAITSASNGNMALTYDGEGRRVKKAWTPTGGATTSTYYVYNALGQLAAEYSTQAPDTGTSYPFTDMLGSVRAVSNSSGSLSECYDYLSFGRMLGSADNGRSSAGCYPNLSQPLSSRLPQKFTGKERDGETGLDFFGARYFSGAQGRLTSPDPSKLSAFIDNPQSWNQYSYAYNEPFQFVDKNGRWPARIHNQIIDAAFPTLSPAQREILKEVSLEQDSLLGGGQSPTLAFQHGMRGPRQSVAGAQAAYNAFVADHLNRATQAQINFWAHGNAGLSNDALKQFAMALHAILDSTSPEHLGFQEWNWNPLSALVHRSGERLIMSWELDNGAKMARDSFSNTFGGSGQLFNPFDLLELLSRQGSNSTPSPGTGQTPSISVCITYPDGHRECQ